MYTDTDNKRHSYTTTLLGVFLLLFFAGCTTLFAQNMTSTSFEIENPQIILEGGMSSSASFQYFSSTDMYTIEESTSSSFTNRPGFLYFPIASTPIVSVTSGTEQATVTWTVPTATFANITSYELGVSTTVNGTYAYTDVGNVSSYVKTGLTGGATYFFKVRVKALGIILSESTSVSATISSSGVVSGGGGGGGGGGGDSTVSYGLGSVVLSGNAYPNRVVTVLKDAQVVATTVADSNARFSITLNSISSGNYIFSTYSEDVQGNRSALLTFPVSVTAGSKANIGGVFIAPTIDIDKTQVKQGDNLIIFGQTLPQAEVTISVHSPQEFFNKVKSDSNGAYLYNFDTSVLNKGDHQTVSKTAKDAEISIYGKPAPFIVGDVTVFAKKAIKNCPAKGDMNNDCKVNLIDYSIAAYWYRRPLDSAIMVTEKAKLSGDGKIDLVDFSMMAFYWTG